MGNEKKKLKMKLLVYLLAAFFFFFLSMGGPVNQTWHDVLLLGSGLFFGLVVAGYINIQVKKDELKKQKKRI